MKRALEKLRIIEEQRLAKLHQVKIALNKKILTDETISKSNQKVLEDSDIKAIERQELAEAITSSNSEIPDIKNIFRNIEEQKLIKAAPIVVEQLAKIRQSEMATDKEFLVIESQEGSIKDNIEIKALDSKTISKSEVTNKSISEVVEAVVDANRILQNNLAGSMKDKIKALNELKLKQNELEDLIKSELRAQGKSCDEAQFNYCETILNDLFKNCVKVRYELDKCSYEVFDTFIKTCVGNCSSDSPDYF
jgi:hypothetical protein